MFHKAIFSVRYVTCGVVIALAMFAVAGVADAAAKNWKPARTPDGHPDLQGVWTNATLTPLERLPKFGGRLIVTEKEAADVEHEQADFRSDSDKPTDPKLGIKDLPKDCGGGFSGVDCGYNNFWIDSGTRLIELNGEKRSSIITDPANGKVPPLTPSGRAAITKLYAAFRTGGSEGPEQRPLGERCLLSFDSSSGPPMLPLLYNNNYQIIQTPQQVTILVEMIHDVRTIRMGGKHLPSTIRLWMGDSIGHWQGDTLVVETTNFRADQFFRGASADRKVTEYFTRVSPQKIDYKFTIDDPTSFTQPWGGELAFNATNEHIFEYACHEGNYALPGILAGARAEEAAKKK